MSAHPDEHVRRATEHVAFDIQADYVPEDDCQCLHCVPARAHHEWSLTRPYVHTAPHFDDRSEQMLTNAHCPRCGRPADYCASHNPCAQGSPL